ncbi:MAG: VOC family protein [Candidatus Woesebacteria bacterium]
MNPVVHFEIPVQDIERAKKFYQDVFDWKLEGYPGSTVPYVMATTSVTNPETRSPQTPGQINGALTQDPKMKATVVTMSVEDIDATIAKIQSMGGVITEAKVKVGDMGWNARLTDSEGNEIGLWQDIKK